MELENLQVKISIDNSQVKTGVKSTETELAKLEKSWSAITKEIESCFGSIKKLYGLNGSNNKLIDTTSINSAADGILDLKHSLQDLRVDPGLIDDYVDIVNAINDTQEVINSLQKDLPNVFGTEEEHIKAEIQEYNEYLKELYGYLQESQNKINGAMKNQQQKSNSSGGSGTGIGSMLKGIAGAILGITGIFALVRKIVSQNEKLSSAIQNLFSTLANVLEPVFNVLASIINGISTALSKIFKVSTVNKNANEKTANNTAGFDELNVISPESSSSTTNPEDDKSAGALIGKGLVDIIVGALEIILGAVEIVIGVIGALIYGITLIVQGAFIVLGAVIMAVVTVLTVAIDLFMIIVSIIAGFLVAIKEGFTSFINALINGEGWGAALEAFKDKFSEAFSVIMKFVDDKIVKKSIEVLKKLWRGIIDVLINPVIDGMNVMCSGFAKCINLCIRGIEWVANGFVDVINGIVAIINAIPGVNVGYLNRVSIKRMSEEAKIPKLNTGTNYVAAEGLAYLHEGEAVVPKKYNPAADGIGNKEVVDALYTILDALNEKDMTISIGDEVIGRANNRYINKIGKTIISGSFADVY